MTPAEIPLQSTEAAGTHRCARCRVDKQVSAFRLDSFGRPRSYCIACQLVVNQEWRARNRPALLARRRAKYRAEHPATPYTKRRFIKNREPLHA